MRLDAALIVPRGRWCALASCAATILTISGCGAGSRAGDAPGPGRAVVGVTERDFHISTTLTHVSAGEVTLRIHNQGPDEHELIVAPERKGGVPLRSDGFTVDEQAIQSSEPGSVDPQQPGATEFLKLRLARGRYELFCNMEGHYMAGMHTVLVVG
jgi:uncharacterized cupredoxin-like copper-binding protein